MKRARSSTSLVAFSFATAVTACGGGGSSPAAPSAGGTSSAPQGGSTGGAPIAAGGAISASGGSPQSGGAGAVSGSTSDGGASSTGGAGPATSGGADTSGAGAGAASLGGSGGSGGGAIAAGGLAQGGEGSSDDMAAAAVLNRYQLLDPCQSSYKAVATPGDVCPQDTAVKNQHITLTFGGDATITYNVTLRVRAIMEGYWYTGGTLDPTSKQFYTGGIPTVGGFSSACKNKTSSLPFTLPAEISPSDSCWNGFNAFALTVSQPNTHYYLNYTADKNGDRPPHAVYPSDYTVTIPIMGQAKLDFYIIGSDEHECYNFNKIVSGVPLPQSPYIGEFVQFDVTNVTRGQ